MRINLVGSGGSGKSRLAVALAARLACPYVELDALHWGPNWTEAPLADFRAQVAALAAGERWVIDGNYGGKIRDSLAAHHHGSLARLWACVLRWATRKSAITIHTVNTLSCWKDVLNSK